ncbi:MAG: hypothetical protein QXT25_00395 [Candidatus Anstonellaceae archaeon]
MNRLLEAAALFAIAALVLIYFTSQQAASKPQSTAEELFINALQKDLELENSYLRYIDIENKVRKSYTVLKGSNVSWVKEEGEYGALEAFFSNNSSVLCLTYMQNRKCTDEFDSNTQQLLRYLSTRLPEKQAAQQNIQLTKKLIEVGAIKFSNEIDLEKVGKFEAQKIKYNLDYRHLTVQNLTAIGISPNDPRIYSVVDWEVLSWIDKKSGRLVKSQTRYNQNGLIYSFVREFEEIEVPTSRVVEKPTEVVGKEQFAVFYTAAEEDYSAKQTCLVLQEQERWGCLKGLAVEKKSEEICNLIGHTQERERCFLILAQLTRNEEICARLQEFGDDCYIAVVSEIGKKELCSMLKNQDLTEVCQRAVLIGERKEAERKAEEEQRLAGRNCQTDQDCYVAGNQNQYCVPLSNKGPFVNETSPLFDCLKGVACGCVEGYCAFKKDQKYYECVNRVEDEMIKEMISSFIKNQSEKQSG